MLTDHQLRTGYRAVYRNVYVPKDAPVTAAVTARAAWLWAGGNCVLAGMSAAAVHGTKWLDGASPAELVRANRHSPAGIVVRSYDLAPEQIRRVNGMRVTTAERTAFDIGRSLPAPHAVPILDALMRATGITAGDVTPLATAGVGARGVRRLRATLEMCDACAESPQESRLRVLLIAAGLPKPQAQIEFFDEYGHAFIRVDMGWPQWKVAVEYDGVQHWNDARQRAWDIERIALLESRGWVVIRVSAAMLSRPQVVVDRVRHRLRAAGCAI